MSLNIPNNVYFETDLRNVTNIYSLVQKSGTIQTFNALYDATVIFNALNDTQSDSADRTDSILLTLSHRTGIQRRFIQNVYLQKYSTVNVE